MYTDTVQGREVKLPDHLQVRNIDGIAYEVDKNVTHAMLLVLMECMEKRIRVTLDYGDTTTGKSWGETCDVSGYIGRSTGILKVLILVANSRSHGGGAILTGSILSIKTSKGKKLLWSHKGA
jgi:hypothetical protein